MADIKTEHEFYESTHDKGLWKGQEFVDGDFQMKFNEAAEFVEGADCAGERVVDGAPDWKQRAEVQLMRHWNDPDQDRTIRELLQ